MNRIFITFLLIGVICAGCTSQNSQPTQQTTPRAIPTEQAQATQESTASSIPKDWKTYTNESFGITFSYPPDYIEPKISNNELISLMSPIDTTKVKNQNVNENELKMEIYIQPKKETDTLESFITEHGHSHQEENNILEEKDVIIDNQEAHYHKVQGLGVVDNFFLVTDTYKILIIKYPNETKRQSEFDTILQSIKFTK